MKLGKLLTVFFLTTIALSVKAQIPEGVKSYAVIGAFKLEQNANKFAAYHAGNSLDTQVKENKFNNMFYVYVQESMDIELVRRRVLDLREQFESLDKTWLYNGNFNCLHIPSDQLKQKQLATTERPEDKREEQSQKIINETVNNTVTPALEKSEKKSPLKPDGKFWVVFNTYNATDLKEIPGHILMEDAERTKELGKFPSLELVTINDPKNGTRKVQFKSDIFGYRVEERLVDLDDPSDSESADALTMLGDSIVVDMPLKRYNRGDYMTMWNVYFYIDAAIMKEESVLELNQLLDLMKENESIKIKIHGHTNGNSKGVVKHLDLDDKAFFTLNGSHLETRASAKKLSEFRAYTIQHWLMDQGIEESRMEIKGWGGKKMIYDKLSTNADKNVRVEIEILEE